MIKKIMSLFRSGVKFKDAEEQNSYALTMFVKATELMYKKKFRKAEKVMSQYSSLIDYDLFDKSDRRGGNELKVSVVVVAYNTNQLLIDCLNSLLAGTDDRYEIIVVDNGGNEEVHHILGSLKIMHIKCPCNLILSEGRNIGVSFARGEVVAFLDDDALVPKDYVASIIKGYERYDITGFRGKVLPKTENKNNEAIAHYNPGTIAVPSIINAEGNSSFKREVYNEYGGMNPLLFGHEGWELSCRIVRKYGYNSLIYWPETVIYHDYAVTDKKLNTKNSRHSLMSTYIKKRMSNAKKYRKDLKEYQKDESSMLNGEKLIKRKDGK